MCPRAGETGDHWRDSWVGPNLCGTTQKNLQTDLLKDKDTLRETKKGSTKGQTQSYDISKWLKDDN